MKNLDRHIGNLVVLLALVSYFEVFKFSVIPENMRFLSQVVVIGIMVVLLILRLIYQPEKVIRMHFFLPVLLLLLGALPSYIIANTYHNQSYIVSLWASRIIWFYLLYYFVHVYKTSPDYIIRLIIGIGLFAVFLYYVHLVIYPTTFIDARIMERRGTLRIFVAGLLCTQVAYFYYLNRFFENNRFSDLALALVTMSVFVLQGTRQLIGAVVILTLVNLFFSRRVKGRLVKIGLLTLMALAVFFVFRDIFLELTEVSAQQISDLAGGVRLRAAKFFLTSAMPSDWAYMFGNGAYALDSPYSIRMDFYAMRYGFFIVDIGIIGDYYMYGIIFIIAGLVLLGKSILFRVSPKYRYLKYYILMQCFTLLTGFGILGGVDVLLLLIIYLFDHDRHQRNQKIPVEEGNLKLAT